MYIIAILNQKGGSGKTTLAINLASYLSASYDVLLVDTDPQASARDWAATSDNDETTTRRITIAGLDRATLTRDLPALAKNFDFVVIDGEPRANLKTGQAIALADLVLIPIQPSPFDVWASPELVELIKQRQAIANEKPLAAFVVSNAKANTVLGRDITNALLELELPLLKSRTHNREAYKRFAASGRSVLDAGGAAASEIINIGREVLDILGVKHGVKSE